MTSTRSDFSRLFQAACIALAFLVAQVDFRSAACSEFEADSELSDTSFLQTLPAQTQQQRQQQSAKLPGSGGRSSNGSRRRRRNAAVDWSAALAAPGPLGGGVGYVFLAVPPAGAAQAGPVSFFQMNAEVERANASEVATVTTDPMVSFVSTAADDDGEGSEVSMEGFVDAAFAHGSAAVDAPGSDDVVATLGEVAAVEGSIDLRFMEDLIGSAAAADAPSNASSEPVGNGAAEAASRGTEVGEGFGNEAASAIGVAAEIGQSIAQEPPLDGAQQLATDARTSENGSITMLGSETASVSSWGHHVVNGDGLPKPPSSEGAVLVDRLALKLGFGAVVMMLALATISSVWRGKTSSDGLCQVVRHMPITSPAQIRTTELNSGALVRLQGRVRCRPAGFLTAPFSDRACAMYSASVTRCRHDSIHSPPLAYHAARNDFVLEVAGEPGVSLLVHSHDVELFSMAEGLHVREHVFSAAPEPCRGFVMSHMLAASDASAQFGACVDLSSDGTDLEFRECALLEGALVSCVGQIVRDRKGDLGLHPWQPESVDSGAGRSTGFRWLRDAAPLARKGSRSRTSLIGRVMVTEDVGLTGTATW
mmetsp:Transcript_14886/g.52215  ORF Transcript_14886/g.52215 Transcript_14886/m.52215 type:complete len:593 (+) Transcript_14886:139-1917(+)